MVMTPFFKDSLPFSEKSLQPAAFSDQPIKQKRLVAKRLIGLMDTHDFF
jgi:hypothetical protein